ncbi:hypothetical protein [uncultured Amnibacterium sp.]|uniref:hypothetical protein n=1 Tax=uncultured Amnibacterium sp. TaxID=1631851 RepID=UPI0035CAB2FB
MPSLVIAGHAVVIGKQPDGDSVRFVPDDPSLLRRLQHGERVRISADGSVQLRLDGIDAPELHYQHGAQLLAAEGRDALLHRIGFQTVTFAADGTTATAADPPTVELVVLAQLVEVNGRPVFIVFAGETASRLGAVMRFRAGCDVNVGRAREEPSARAVSTPRSRHTRWQRDAHRHESRPDDDHRSPPPAALDGHAAMDDARPDAAPGGHRTRRDPGG